ncbi:PREDICTED: microtubule-associated protein 10, partial [Acanthisitta chloris]|uniref:microtubule-associated protein 10 n=1 Tax=Acanthisitta chloris TaxID=57068 RepID=UPI0004F0F879
RESAEPHGPPAAVTTGQWEHVEAQRPQEKDKGQSPPRPSAGPSLLHPASPRQLHSALGQLPVLSALLAELSVLARNAVPGAVHPHLPWLYQAAGNSGTASRPPSHSALKPSEIPLSPGGAVSPQCKEGWQGGSPESSGAERGPKKAVPQRKPASEGNCKAKENRPPRRTLLYGLTRTLRLRVQRTNPGNPIMHERREQYRRKQLEMLKERSPIPGRKLLRNAGEQHVVSCRDCSRRGSSKQNNRLDKTIQTSLENSAVTESMSVAGDVSPDLQKQAIAKASLSDEEQEAQQISKEDRGDQHIKHRSTLRSKQVRSDTDLNTGKGQTSAGEEQSVAQVSSYLPSNMSDLELGILQNSMSGEEDDFLGKLHAPNQYKYIDTEKQAESRN